MLERSVSKKLESLRGGGERVQPTEQEVEYLLNIVPYIQQYYGMDGGEEEEAGRKTDAGALEGYCTVDGRTRRNYVYNKYLLEVEKDTANVSMDRLMEGVRVQAVWTCEACDAPLILDATNDELVCPKCGVTTRNSSMQLTYEQEQNSTTLVSTFSYKRLNHLTETLNAVCCVADVEVPEEVVQAVRAEYMRMRGLTQDDITPNRTRAILKKLRLNKHYEHAFIISARLNGKGAPKISKQLFNEFQRHFLQIQKPFERVVPRICPNRKNFLSYTYTCHQLSRILGRPDLCPWFSLLKSTAKLHEQDMIWKAICAELNWPFHPTC